MDITPIPLNEIAGAAALFAVLVAGITQVVKKLGACDAHVILVAIASGQGLTWAWLLLPKPIFFTIVVGIAATLTAMGLWQVIKPPPTP